MNLNLIEGGAGLVYKTGQDVMNTNGVVLFGMSPGNPFYKSRVIEDYVRYLGKENRRIIVVVPGQPAEHTYRAMGSKNAIKRAKKNSSKLKTDCSRAIEKVSKTNGIAGEFYMLDWTLEVTMHEAYITALDFVKQFYNNDAVFRLDVALSTAKVLGKELNDASQSGFEDDENVQEGVLYQLKELAFVISSKEMFRTDSVAVIYHRRWEVYEKFVNGDYDGQPKEGLGLAVINYQ